MARGGQSDLFATSSGQFDEDTPTPVYRADPDEVRAELCRIVAGARGAKTLLWEPRRANLAIHPSTTLLAVATGKNSRVACSENPVNQWCG